METLAERLLFLLTEKGCNQTDVATAAGVRSPSVSAWFSGDTKSLRTKPLINTAAYFGVSPTWLATGQGEMRPDGTTPALTPKETAYIGLFRGLTESQQEEEIRRLTAQKQTNDAIIAELTNPARRRA